MSRYLPCPRCKREYRDCLHPDYHEPDRPVEDTTWAREGYRDELSYRRGTDPKKLCRACDCSLPLVDFTPRKDRPGKYLSHCKPCRAFAQAERLHAELEALAWSDFDCDCPDGVPCPHTPEDEHRRVRRERVRASRAKNPKPETARARKIRERLAQKREAARINEIMLAKLDRPQEES